MQHLSMFIDLATMW